MNNTRGTGVGSYTQATVHIIIHSVSLSFSSSSSFFLFFLLLFSMGFLWVLPQNLRQWLSNSGPPAVGPGPFNTMTVTGLGLGPNRGREWGRGG